MGNIVAKVIFKNKLPRLQRLVEFIPKKQFIEQILNPDEENMNGLEYAIKLKKIDVIKYLFSFDDIKKEYMSNKELIWRSVFWMNEYNDKSVVEYLTKALKLNGDISNLDDAVFKNVILKSNKDNVNV